MSILINEDRADLVYAMRKTLLERVRGTGVLTESKRVSAENFILNEGTYEQLLNLTFNPKREEKYLPAEVLETVALKLYEGVLKAEAKAVSEKSKFEELEEGARTQAARKAVGAAASKTGKWIADKAGSAKEKAGHITGATNLKTGMQQKKLVKQYGKNNVPNLNVAANKELKKGAAKAAATVGVATVGTGAAVNMRNRRKNKKK